jgi:hypothetical protein
MNNMPIPPVVYTLQCFGRDGKIKWTDKLSNLTPYAARDYWMAASLVGGTQHSSFYVNAFQNVVNPTYDDVATDITSYGEITDWVETDRQLFVPGSLTGGQYTNSLNEIVYTAAAAVTVMGVFMTTTSLFGSTTGLLFSVVRGASPRELIAGETLRIPITISGITS